jgi:hypothetical protein
MSVCLYSCLSYQACKAQAPYYSVICGLSDSTLILHIIAKKPQIKKKSLNTKCAFLFSLKILPEAFLILRIIHRDTSTNVRRFPWKVGAMFFRFQNWPCSTDFRKTLKYQISWISAQWEPSCSMSTDGQTDMTKLTAAFRNFANAPKNRQTDTARSSFHNVLFLQAIQHSSLTHNASVFHYFCHVCSREAVTFITRNCQTAVSRFSTSVCHSVRI